MTAPSWTLPELAWIKLLLHLHESLTLQPPAAAAAITAAVTAGDVRARAGIDERLEPSVDLWVQLTDATAGVITVPVVSVPCAALDLSEDDWRRLVDIELGA